MKKVLIVDDKDENLYLLKIILEAHGFNFTGARNGVEALQRARSDPPDVVVSDILMPVMDGFTLLREWIKDNSLANIPLIIYTLTGSDPKDEELALRLGAARFIAQPVEPEDFVRLLSKNYGGLPSSSISQSRSAGVDEVVYYRLYSESLFRKLEEKMLELKQKTKEYEEVKNRFEEIARQWQVTFDTIKDGICLLDERQKITHYNKAFLKFVNVQQNQIIGTYCWRIIHGTQEPLPNCLILKAQSSLHRESLELELHGRILDIVVDPVFDSSGALRGAVHIIRDITDKKRTEQALRSRLEELEQWKSITLDREDRVIELKQEVNELCCRLGEPPRYGPDAV